MNRVPLVAGNWKQHKTEAQAITLGRKILQDTRFLTGADILVCPPYTALSTLNKLFISSPIQLGAQDLSRYPGGAHTGEISPEMIREFCTHVIIGHSERRALFGEDSAILLEKITRAHRADLIPIFCVGEGLEIREKGLTTNLIRTQLMEVLGQITFERGDQIIIAYEPVWAIGTGRSASPEDVSQVIRGVIRPLLSNLWGDQTSQEIRVLYGGSVNPENAPGYFREKEIDGALVGGASLDARAFAEIIRAAQSIR